ncbi:hypothetical protein BN77_2261 [Rhizobium mesoamericanum STM3625]|uniref:Uncharacterized protein n=1 Tax=Rhizobium mesoamericanum STM3625 TaxID=1211777 RepID=K0PUM6_9HYPH|nr:hypothetical protein BN77_2261 [Rhizobium mesoamericanum STM3625]
MQMVADCSRGVDVTLAWVTRLQSGNSAARPYFTHIHAVTQPYVSKGETESACGENAHGVSRPTCKMPRSMRLLCSRRSMIEIPVA